MRCVSTSCETQNRARATGIVRAARRGLDKLASCKDTSASFLHTDRNKSNTESTTRAGLRQDHYAPPPSCAGLAAGEIRSIGDAARAGDGDDSRVKSTTSDASDERLMAFEYGVCAPE